MTGWEPDTCDCICDVEKKIIVSKCKIHTTYNQVVSHNQSFNLKYGSLMLERKYKNREKAIEDNNLEALDTWSKFDEIIEDKKIEKQRIRNLPDV